MYCNEELYQKLIRLYSEYCEGYIESSKDEYNKIAKRGIPVSQVRKLVEFSPFYRQVLTWHDVLENAKQETPKTILKKRWAESEKKFYKELHERVTLNEIKG